MESSATEQYILGDPQLHARFALAIELLTSIVVVSPRPQTTAMMAAESGQPPSMVRNLLEELAKSGMIYCDSKTQDGWCCSGGLNDITLADVFRCIASMALQSSASGKQEVTHNKSGRARTKVQRSGDLLLMQATMAINQVVLQHLRAFDLSRLKTLASVNPFQIRNLSARSPIA